VTTSTTATAFSFSDLPVGSAAEPLPLEHFPSTLHAAVWRNWEVVDSDALARVLDASTDEIEGVARSMGFGGRRTVSERTRDRLYMTIIRRNWQLLDYEQICELVGWDAVTMDVALREDDFLWAKLGSVKPAADRLRYRTPSAEEEAHAARIARFMAEERGLDVDEAEPLFAFEERDRSVPAPEVGDSAIPLRMVYPNSLPYGDPLSGDAVDEVPDSYLREIAASGVNALWLQVVLSQVAPWAHAPELSDGWEHRLERLRRFIDRCEVHGLRVIAYLNEPRALPAPFFTDHPEWEGVRETPSRAEYSPDVRALCTSTHVGRAFVVDAVAHLFREVPKLGGVVAITFSENLTNCFSREYAESAQCPRCRERGPAEVNADVYRLIDQGMTLAGSDGALLAYLWATPDEWLDDLIEGLPERAWATCISEWGTPFRRGSYEGIVNEYSISVVGPSERSTQSWRLAHKRGLRAVAKMQIANSFELYTMPYIPALRLVAEHLHNVVSAGVDGLMLGWTAGGNPSPNLSLVAEFLRDPGVGVDAAMEAVASRRFGADAARVVDAWHALSDAYESFPYDINVCYAAPQSVGPANLLYRDPTGYRPGMITFPYDGLELWRGPYDAVELADLFAELAEKWDHGVALLAQAHAGSDSAALEDEWRVAAACGVHFRSAANQIRYILARSDGVAATESLLRDEIACARALRELARRDSRLGFEATAQYMYVDADLLEKILNCRALLEERPTA
jgi:hypothetical protein